MCVRTRVYGVHVLYNTGSLLNNFFFFFVKRRRSKRGPTKRERRSGGGVGVGVDGRLWEGLWGKKKRLELNRRCRPREEDVNLHDLLKSFFFKIKRREREREGDR